MIRGWRKVRHETIYYWSTAVRLGQKNDVKRKKGTDIISKTTEESALGSFDLCFASTPDTTVMKPNESAKEHPVSFVGNQIRGNQRKHLDARLNGSHSYHTWKLWQATTRVVIVVLHTFRTFWINLISNLHYVPRNISVLETNGSLLHLPWRHHSSSYCSCFLLLSLALLSIQTLRYTPVTSFHRRPHSINASLQVELRL